MAVAKKLKLDKSGGIDIKADSYIGLLLGVVHLGTQKNIYKGVTSFVDQLLLQFELQDLILDNGKPVVVSKVVRNSMKAKANLVSIGRDLGADVEEGIDFDELVGKPIMVEMGLNEAKTKVTVKGFSKLPKLLAKEVKPLMSTPRVLLDVDEITDSQVTELPDWVGKLIQGRVKSRDSSDDGSSIEL